MNHPHLLAYPHPRHYWQRRGMLMALLVASLSVSVLGASRDHKPRAVQPEGVTVAAKDLPPASANLMPDAGFQEPARDGTHPAHWQQIDDLVWQWTTDPADPPRGKVMRIDTDVYQSQAYRWWANHFVHHMPLAKAPEKRVPRGHKYSTIGGLDGGWYWSDYIPIPPHSAIRVYVDAKGPASKVFIRGYVNKVPITFASEEPATEEMLDAARGKPHLDAKGHQIMHRLHYLYTTWFPVGGSKHWKTYTHTMPRHPNDNEITQGVRYIRIMLYPSWPAGVYWYDNVRVVLVKGGGKQDR